MDQQPRHPLNAPGPFYATGGCMACGAPEDEAPTLLSELTAENYDTYFVRQPETPEEIEQACRAIRVCCVDSLRYAGTDPSIIERLGNTPNYCDHLAPRELTPITPRVRSFAFPAKRWWHFWR